MSTPQHVQKSFTNKHSKILHLSLLYLIFSSRSGTCLLSLETNLVINLYQCDILSLFINIEQDSTRLLSVAKFVKHMRHVNDTYFSIEMRNVLKGSE